MPTRLARTSWHGTSMTGSGDVTFVASKTAPVGFSYEERVTKNDMKEGMTSPEALVAAAASGCYSMALATLVGRAGGNPKHLDVEVEVHLVPEPRGGTVGRLATMKYVVGGEVDGLDEATFQDLAEKALRYSPVATALVDTTKSVTATLG
ncbi:OsmC family peroxiredoxin [Streptomyces sp. NPDC047043]|uniref:OsmC family peroxiredoxin n=1 Tax=Streptomyces sp. NPDC047043 TaxID=3154497 RepID=UPI0033E3FC5B